MSLQDNYFDVRAALDGTPEQEDFERIWAQFCELEEANDRMGAALQTLKNAMQILELLGEDPGETEK